MRDEKKNFIIEQMDKLRKLQVEKEQREAEAQAEKEEREAKHKDGGNEDTVRVGKDTSTGKSAK